MTERVARLRRQSLDQKPTLSSERAELMTAFYRDAPAAPLPILRAWSFQYLIKGEVPIPEAAAHLGLNEDDLRREFAPLRHMEKLRGCKKDDIIYLTLF